MKKIGVLMLVGAFLLSSVTGCANIQNDQTRTKTEGTLVGAGAGAVVGGVLGQLIGGNTTATLVGAGVGALVGSAAGFAYGSHVANEKAKYAKQEDWLNACIASAQQVNADTRAYNDRLASEVRSLDAETKRLAQAYDQKRAQKSQLLAEKKKVDASLAAAKQKLERAKYELSSQQKVLAEAKSAGKAQHAAKLDQQINQLKAQIAELEGHTQSLASMSARMSV